MPLLPLCTVISKDLHKVKAAKVKHSVSSNSKITKESIDCAAKTANSAKAANNKFVLLFVAIALKDAKFQHSLLLYQYDNDSNMPYIECVTKAANAAKDVILK